MSSNRVQNFADKLYGLNWNRRNFSVLLILSGALAILMFGMNINARWWVIDDHEILYFLGSDHILRTDEILEKLTRDTEIGHYLHMPRFRPVYYIIRLLECRAWGAKPSLWYAFRITVFASFVAFFWYLISHKVGSVIGGFISLYIAIQKYWSDIFGSLGPSESYAALGLVLFGWGIHTIYKSDKVAGWWCLFVGAVVCSGTKENFLFLLLPLLYIVWDFYKNGKLNFVKATLSLGACVWMIWIGLVVFISTQSRGGDIYANSVGIKDRFIILIGLFERVDVIVLLSFCVGLLFLKRSIHVKIPSISKDFEKTAASAIILTLIYISQIFIYNGEWPVGTRYDFPGALIGPLMLVVLISFLQKLTMENNHARLRTGLILLSTFGVFLLAFFQLDNIIKIRNATSQNIARTVAFSEKMEQLANLGIQNPDHVLIIQADNPIWDYEPVISYFRFFRFLGVKNQISFLWAGRKPEAYDNGFSASLASDLRDLSFYGKLPPMLAGNERDFTPCFDVDGSEMECILLVISGESQKECSIIVSSNWR